MVLRSLRPPDPGSVARPLGGLGPERRRPYKRVQGVAHLQEVGRVPLDGAEVGRPGVERQARRRRRRPPAPADAPTDDP